MIPKDGKLLTAEQSVRLAICANADREKLIAGIVAHLRKHARSNHNKFFAAGRPRDWYAASNWTARAWP